MSSVIMSTRIVSARYASRTSCAPVDGSSLTTS
jgi:hypothetical protein